MPRRALIALCLLLLPAAFFLAPSRAAGEDEIQPVRVTNFPGTQRIAGSVSIEKPVPQAALVSFHEIELPPVTPTDPRRLISAGVLTTDGFGAVVLSLSGTAKGRAPKAGEVGVLLVPDEEPIVRLMEEQGILQFPLEMKAPISINTAFFSSPQERRVVGFPRYRILLYNTSDRLVTADLYAYLTM